MRKEIEQANIYHAWVALIFMLNILFYFMAEKANFWFLNKLFLKVKIQVYSWSNLYCAGLLDLGENNPLVNGNYWIYFFSANPLQ